MTYSKLNQKVRSDVVQFEILSLFQGIAGEDHEYYRFKQSKQPVMNVK